MSRYALVVDDAPVIRKVLRKFLENLQFEVDEAEDGLDALKCCEKRWPDVIFLDWNMPRMDGLEFAKIFKGIAEKKMEEDGFSPSPIIFCTTENTLPKIQMALEIGAAEYIMKPFDEDVIKDKLIVVGVLPPDFDE
jgi:two-component system chemotaxis response regulator CheY